MIDPVLAALTLLVVLAAVNVVLLLRRPAAQHRLVHMLEQSIAQARADAETTRGLLATSERALAGSLATLSTTMIRDQGDARALLEGAGVGLDDAEVNELLARTERWPVGLYLAALAHKAGGPPRHAWAGFTGDDRFMADYLWSELLGQLPP